MSNSVFKVTRITYIEVDTVVPGFKALGPLTALSALNPGSALNLGTNLLSYMEIVSTHKLYLILNNSIFSQNSSQ